MQWNVLNVLVFATSHSCCGSSVNLCYESNFLNQWTSVNEYWQNTGCHGNKENL